MHDIIFVPYSFLYTLYTLLVFDEWKNGIPVASIVIGKSRENDLHLVFQALSKCLHINWMPNAIIVDNALVEINVLR